MHDPVTDTRQYDSNGNCMNRRARETQSTFISALFNLGVLIRPRIGTQDKLNLELARTVYKIPEPAFLYLSRAE